MINNGRSARNSLVSVNFPDYIGKSLFTLIDKWFVRCICNFDKHKIKEYYYELIFIRRHALLFVMTKALFAHQLSKGEVGFLHLDHAYSI